MRAAGNIAAESGWLIWNHGGSGDDVELAHPGHVVSVLTPTSRYAEPFLRSSPGRRERGTISASSKDPVASAARWRRGRGDRAGSGLGTVRVGPDDQFPPPGLSAEWALFSAACSSRTQNSSARCSDGHPAAPGLRRIGGRARIRRAVDDPDGVFGVAQWFPGSKNQVMLGPPENDFLSTMLLRGTLPDYPAAQAAAAAIIAAHARGGPAGRAGQGLGRPRPAWKPPPCSATSD